MPYAGQQLLVGLIRFYRRFLAGRGPLRSVVCTFCRSESCSAYGLRVADEVATSLAAALRLIRARLRRCRRAALYRYPDGWGWGDCYDEPAAAVASQLERAHELPPTRSAVLWSGALVARHRGDAALTGAYARRAGECGGPAVCVVVRDGRKLRPAMHGRLRVRLALGAVLLAAACALPLPLSPVGVWVTVVAALGWWQAHRRESRRFALQVVANGFRIPGQAPPRKAPEGEPGASAAKRILESAAALR